MTDPCVPDLDLGSDEATHATTPPGCDDLAPWADITTTTHPDSFNPYPLPNAPPTSIVEAVPPDDVYLPGMTLPETGYDPIKYVLTAILLIGIGAILLIAIGVHKRTK